jgi:hypothetical protein
MVFETTAIENLLNKRHEVKRERIKEDLKNLRSRPEKKKKETRLTGHPGTCWTTAGNSGPSRRRGRTRSTTWAAKRRGHSDPSGASGSAPSTPRHSSAPGRRLTPRYLPGSDSRK